MANDAHRSDPDEPRPEQRPQDAGAGAEGSWPPPPGQQPSDDNPAAADQPTPQQPTEPWQRPGPWERPAGWDQPTEPWRGGDQPGGAAGGPAQDPWWGEDETAIHPASGEETTALPPAGPEATSVVPGFGEPRDQSARWSARAGVPPGGAPPGIPPQADPQWYAVEETRGGAWWMPILIGIIVLILLALLGLGLWLALRGDDHHQPPVPVPTSTPSTSVPSPTPSPTPSPSLLPSSAPAPVALPALRGLTTEEAQAVLSGLGLTAAVQPQQDDTFPPGTVLGTQPGAGSSVLPGSQVILFVAAAPQSPASPSLNPGPVSPTGSPSLLPPPR